MHNFVFHAPTKIVFGRDTVKEIGAEVGSTSRKVVLVYGKGSIKRNGIYDAVCDSLSGAGVEWVEMSGVQPNPVLSHLREGVELARREKVDGALGVGGGSVVDMAKAVAVGAANDRDVWDFFTGTEVERCLPVFDVMTVAATGSEMNANAVITNEETRQKWPIRSQLTRPRVSVLDPTTTFSVPPDYTAYGGVDAIAHVIEGYFNGRDPHTPLQDRFVESIVKTVLEATGDCLADPNDYEARATLLWSAALALNGLTLSGVDNGGFPCHMMEHSLSALYDVPHGAGLSVIIPGWARYASRSRPEKFARFAREVFGVSDADDASAASAGIDAFESWCDAIKSPTRLSAFGIPAADIDAIAANAVQTSIAWGIGDTYPQDVIREVLELCV